MTVYVGTGFTQKMLPVGLAYTHEEISYDEFNEAVHDNTVKSYIGHQDTADLFKLPCDRVTVTVEDGDIIYLCELQNLTGTRLPEGIKKLTDLPEGYRFTYKKGRIFKAGE